MPSEKGGIENKPEVSTFGKGNILRSEGGNSLNNLLCYFHE